MSPKVPGGLKALVDLLPELEAEQIEVHLGATLLTTATATQLIALAHQPRLSRYLLGRLAPVTALCDPGSAGRLAEALEKQGQGLRRSSTLAPVVAPTSLPFAPRREVDLVALSLQEMGSDGRRRAARHWLGKAANGLPSAEAQEQLRRQVEVPARVGEMLATLRPEQRAILEVVQAHGGRIHGPLLLAELRTRNLLPVAGPEATVRGWQRERDPVAPLRELLLLLRTDTHYVAQHGLDPVFPTLALLPAARKLVAEAKPLPWPGSGASDPPSHPESRPPADLELEVHQVIAALEARQPVAVIKGGSLGKASRAAVARELGRAAEANVPIPDPESLVYELLRTLGAVRIDLVGEHAHLDRKALRQLGPADTATGLKRLVEAWVTVRLWQDGIGVVPERDTYTRNGEAVRIDPERLELIRTACLQGLAAAGRATRGWLDLEAFLKALAERFGDMPLSTYWSGPTWKPYLEMAEKRDSYPAGDKRNVAFWLSGGGVTIANILLGTLYHLGLIERGQRGTSRKAPWSFRLSPLGRAVVIGEAVDSGSRAEHRFLTVQPNFEVVARLDAPSKDLAGLLTLAAPKGATGAPVRTFQLDRSSVTRALEAGQSAEDIVGFLRKYGGEVPENVDRAIRDWAQARDSLVLEDDVHLALFPEAAQRDEFCRQHRADPIGDRAARVSRAAGLRLVGERHALLCDQRGSPRKVWRLSEEGVVTWVEPTDVLASARLRRIAGEGDRANRVDASSVRRAAKAGVDAGVVAAWLGQHAAGASAASSLPGPLQVAIRNWSQPPGRARLAKGLLLQLESVDDWTAVVGAEGLRPHIVGLPGPGWILVRQESREAVRTALSSLGFVVSSEDFSDFPPDKLTRSGTPVVPGLLRRGHVKAQRRVVENDS